MTGRVLGRGHFASVRVGKNGNAVKSIDVDMQRPPHNWRAEVTALKLLNDKTNIVQVIDTTEKLAGMDPEVRIEMHCYRYTLEEAIYHYAKANYPPGSGWRNAMPAQRIVSLTRGIAAGIHAIHSANIIHRDIKPENILLDEYSGEPVIIDFGVAWVPGTSEKTEPEHKRFTDVCTGEYKAPELLYGLTAYTNKIDLWALGCILARLLGQDCQALFTPYRSDIALIAAHFKTLGYPDLAECTSFEEPNIQSTIQNMMSYAGRDINVSYLRWRKLEDPSCTELLPKLALQLLDYEPTNRPNAAAVLRLLNEMIQGNLVK